jgi:hypothetical protein
MSPGKPKRLGRPKRRRAVRQACTVSEFAESVGRSRASIFRWMAAGLIEWSQVGPGYPRMIPLSEIARLGLDPAAADEA